jgi:hypothetical protein
MILYAKPRAQSPCVFGAPFSREGGDPPRSDDPDPVEAHMEPVPIDEQAPSHFGVLARATMAISLIVTAIAVLAITSQIHSHQQATAEARLLLRPAPSMPWSAAGFGDVGPFGFLEFDWDPAAPGGIPGFDFGRPRTQR